MQTTSKFSEQTGREGMDLATLSRSQQVAHDPYQSIKSAAEDQTNNDASAYMVRIISVWELLLWICSP